MTSSSMTVVGNQQLAYFGLPDLIARHQTGLITTFADNYWGGLEAVYVRATGTIRQFGLVCLIPTLVGGLWRYDASEAPSTANIGKACYVAAVSATVGQFFWVVHAGLIPINSSVNIAADTGFANTSVGQAGAVVASKSVLNGRIIAPSTQTVAKTGCTGNSGSTRLAVPNGDGWFAGVYLSGTGIAAGTTVVDIDPSATYVTLSAAMTAAVNGTVTATYNNGVVFYNIAHIDRIMLQGPIT